MIYIRKFDNRLEVSEEGFAGLTDAVKEPLERLLEYQQKRFLYGAERLQNGGKAIQFRLVRLYRYDGLGRLIAPVGFFWRIYRALQALDHPLQCLNCDIEAEDEDADRGMVCWGAVRERFQFRPRQEECLRAILTRPMGVIWAPTGFGKMVSIAMACTAWPAARIDVITRRTTLAEKLWEFLSRYCGRVGRVGGGKRQRGRITVYNADSLHKSLMDADILLCDEAHELLADKYAEFLWRYEHSRNYAFTASPYGRSDGGDLRLVALFGEIIFSMPYWEAAELGLVVPIRVEWTPVELPGNPACGLDGIERKRAGIWRNDDRNRIVAAKAASFAEDDQVLVLVDTIDHALHLSQHLPGWQVVYASGDAGQRYRKRGLLPADAPPMTPARLLELRQRFESGQLKKVIATGVWSTGVDPTHLTALVRAGGGSSEIADIQAPGRVARARADGRKEVGVVCDFVDRFDNALLHNANVRRRHYAAMRWQQTDC